VRRFFTFARPMEEAGSVADAAQNPEEAVQSQAELARINAAIAALPANLRDVLVLRAVEGMSQSDAAQILGVSDKTVETRLYRARNKLAETLRDHADARV